MDKITAANHVKQEPGVLAQAAGDVSIVVMVVLEASNEYLEHIEHGPVLPTDAVEVLHEDEPIGLVQKDRAYYDTI